MDKKMKQLKLDRAWAIAGKAGVHTGATTREHILHNIQQKTDLNVLFGMSSKQIAVVIIAANNSYHNGRASTGADIISDDRVWVDSLGRSFALADLAKLP
jgi:hypothetical protein